MNVALTDPTHVSFDSDSGHLVAAESGDQVVSTLMGTVIDSWNSKWTIRSVCIAPFAQGWYRFAAVLGKVSQRPVLYFKMWKRGALFSASPFSTGDSVAPRGEQRLGTATSGPILGPMESRSSVASRVPRRKLI